MKTKRTVYVALFIAMGVIITRFFSIHTPIVRVGFGFIPTMLSGMFFGPIFGGVVNALVDLIGANIFPTGTFFIGFTISAFAAGIIYGLFFYKKHVNYKNVIIAVVLKVVLVDICLNTLWLSIMMGKGFIALLPIRLVKNIIFIPIESIIFMTLVYSLKNTSLVRKINNVIG
ncbi:folate family ECF transporter S component [Clostridium rectalis]|uniref:folate family ECF transporter S component n=1 Tax=Clostridium rectalis TaxID=2040295 RepID=UPI000F639CD5|nr:folate family ECF transporter S component [Clostridium rectalis]